MATQRTPWQIQRAVVFAMMMREIKTRFGGHWSGVVWLLGIPIAELMMFVWMNTTLRGHTTHGVYSWVVFLISGMMPYQLFRSLWGQLTHAVAANKGLFGFRQVKPMDAFVARAALEIAIDTCTYLVLALGLSRLGYAPMFPHDPLAFLGVVGLFCGLGIGMGITWAVIVDVLPKFNVVTHIIAMPLMIISGVIFPLHALPQEVLGWLLYNPVLHLVELARVAFLPGYVMLQGVNVAFPAMCALVMLSLSIVLYRLQHKQLIAR